MSTGTLLGPSIGADPTPVPGSGEFSCDVDRFTMPTAEEGSDAAQRTDARRGWEDAGLVRRTWLPDAMESPSEDASAHGGVRGAHRRPGCPRRGSLHLLRHAPRAAFVDRTRPGDRGAPLRESGARDHRVLRS